LCAKHAAGGHHNLAAEHETEFGTENESEVTSDDAARAKAKCAAAAEAACARAETALGAGKERAVNIQFRCSTLPSRRSNTFRNAAIDGSDATLWVRRVVSDSAQVRPQLP